MAFSFFKTSEFCFTNKDITSSEKKQSSVSWNRVSSLMKFGTKKKRQESQDSIIDELNLMVSHLNLTEKMRITFY